jgi:hypothetical protein
MRLVTSGWWRSCRGGLESAPLQHRSVRSQHLPDSAGGQRHGPSQAAALTPKLSKLAASRRLLPARARRPRLTASPGVGPPAGRVLRAVAMADALSCDLPAVQVLLDLQQRRIRWRVLLVPRPGSTPLVLFEKRGKGGRLLHRRLAFWSCLESADFLHPRDQVAGGLIPRCLVERIEALLRGAPLPRRRKEWAQLHGRLVHW